MMNSDGEHHHNLPAPLSTFIGRKREMAAVAELLAGYRLLTLTGPGGAGKTRLALRVAAEPDCRYEHGIWLVEFAALSEAELVPRAAAAALRLREQARLGATESLARHLQEREALLIFDNCEHLLPAIARLSATLLAGCPRLRVLATSREPLGVPGEAVFVVPPLSLPEPRPWRSPVTAAESLRAYRESEAIELFVSRAAAAAPGFALTAANAPWVATICRRLDGIPLAIELAAARLRAFTPRQVANRLDDRFRLLTSRLRTVAPRHQALEATLDWSYDLLTAEERRALQRLAVFPGSWTLAAAEAVCSGNGGGGAAVVEVLANLVDKSLVAFNPGAERRYYLLETIRQYALEKLDDEIESGAARDRHLAYYCAWAEAHAPRLAGAGQSAWVERFAAEHDNLRAALEWSSSSGAAEMGLRLAAACGHFWRLHGYLGEGRARLAAALNLAAAQEPTGAQAQALLWSANLAYIQSDYTATRTLAAEALALCRALGPEGRAGVARALDMLGELATEVGDYDSAPELFAEALAIYEALDDTRGRADMLMQLGWAAMRAGDYEAAGRLLDESLPLFRALEEPALLGLVLGGLGELAVRRGELTEAAALLDESLAVRRALGDRWGTAATLGSLGWVALRRRDFERARALLGESMELRLEIGDRGGVAWCLEKLAEALALQAQPLPPVHARRARAAAARVFAAAAALRAPLDSVIDPADRPAYDRLLRALRADLGDAQFTTAWNERGVLALEEITAVALAPALSPAAAADLSAAEAEKIRYGGLTPREREAAALVAEGKSNRAIADAMVVSERTVETYVTRILNKLGFDSRVQIATWAVSTGLTPPLNTE